MNKIYRIIWNNALGVWVVTSELGRGKIKSATSKALTAVALTTVMSTSVLASDCSSSTFICNLDSPVCQPKHEPTDFEITYKSGCLGERNAKANHSS